MAVFQSKHAELGFYVDGVFKSFKNGRYVTEDKKEIEVLETLVDAKQVDEPKAEAKPKTARKTSAK
ncbi:hypothetical protein [Priestia megaterium]|uniref:hypothetical protein n=1 Tax=Priestia megaterium TaxID=1404 RepID=UPI00345A3530